MNQDEVIKGLINKQIKKAEKELKDADNLTDYAVEIRYPDDCLEPTLDETKEAYKIAKQVKEFVLSKINFAKD